MIAHFLVGLPAEEMNGRSCQGAQASFGLPSADDNQLPLQPIAGFNGQLQSLVGSKGRNHQIIILSRNRRGTIEVRIHWRIDDNATSVITLFDAALHGSADGDEMIHPVRRLPIPLLEPFQETIGCRRKDSMSLFGTKVSGTHMPSVAHGRETIADVDRSARGPNRLGHAVAEA